MVNRFWDKENKYAQGFLKEFKHWVWEVSYRQHTLGSFILFAKRSVERISDLTREELISLGMVMKEVEETLGQIEIFRPDRFNYWQMGNQLHHLHIHGIPRYERPRNFMNREWVDETWGRLPVWKKADDSEELIKAIRDAIRPHLL